MNRTNIQEFLTKNVSTLNGVGSKTKKLLKKKNINKFDDNELSDLDKILNYEDEILYKFYFDKSVNKLIVNNKIMKMLKKFKL